MYVRCTILHYPEPFDATLHRLCVRCATRHYPVPFDATLHRLCTVLQMSAKLFAIELVHFTISCSNSTWATRPFIIWLNYPCLGCSVSRRKTKPSIIWPCHSFISYSILLLIFRLALYLLIYLRSLYFWWWRPPYKACCYQFLFTGEVWTPHGDLTATQERSLAAHRAARWWFRCKPGPFFNPSRIVETISLYIHRRKANGN